jgi:uncharacterized protein (UPF0335 family)
MDATAPISANELAGNELKSFVHGIEQLSAQRDLLGRKISRLYKDAKAKGYDRKALHEVVRVRALAPGEHELQNKIVSDYLRVIAHAEEQSAAALSEPPIPWPSRARLMAGR